MATPSDDASPQNELGQSFLTRPRSEHEKEAVPDKEIETSNGEELSSRVELDKEVEINEKTEHNKQIEHGKEVDKSQEEYKQEQVNNKETRESSSSSNEGVAAKDVDAIEQSQPSPESQATGPQDNEATPPAVEAPYSIWTPNQKRALILTASCAAFFSPISGQIYFPALNVISADLNVSSTLVNLTITTYLIMQGLAPSFIGQFADDAGRRPSYLICCVVYIAANIGLALQNSYAGLMVLRMFQSGGSSGTVALANSIVADTVTSAERGIYIAWVSVAPMIGPTIGPIIGGLLAQYTNWHFIFWFLAIMGVVIFIPILFFFPETCRKIVGDGTIPPPKWSRCITNNYIEKNASRKGWTIQYEKRDELARERKLRFPNPFSTVRLLFHRETGFVLLCVGLVLGGFYATTALIPYQFGQTYGFNELQISLCYIPFGVGSLVASFVRGRVIDSRFKVHAKRLGVEIQNNRKTDLTDFPIERARLEVALPTLITTTLSLIGFGWCVEYKTNLAGPLILLFVFGFSASASMNCVVVLLIDVYPGKAGATTAATNLIRCWLGAAATAFVIPMIDAIGVGWTCTFFGLLIVGYTPALVHVMRNGPKWRREEKEKEEKEKAERDVGGEKGLGPN